MKNKVKIYAKVLADLVLDGAKKNITDNFIKLLVKDNYLHKSGEIIALAENIILKRKDNKKIILQTARKTDTKQFINSFYKKGDLVQEIIDPEIIAGVKVIINNEKQLDFSLRKKLEEVFK